MQFLLFINDAEEQSWYSDMKKMDILPKKLVTIPDRSGSIYMVTKVELARILLNSHEMTWGIYTRAQDKVQAMREQGYFR